MSLLFALVQVLLGRFLFLHDFCLRLLAVLGDHVVFWTVEIFELFPVEFRRVFEIRQHILNLLSLFQFVVGRGLRGLNLLLLGWLCVLLDHIVDHLFLVLGLDNIFLGVVHQQATKACALRRLSLTVLSFGHFRLVSTCILSRLRCLGRCHDAENLAWTSLPAIPIRAAPHLLLGLRLTLLKQ